MVFVIASGCGWLIRSKESLCLLKMLTLAVFNPRPKRGRLAQAAIMSAGYRDQLDNRAIISQRLRHYGVWAVSSGTIVVIHFAPDLLPCAQSARHAAAFILRQFGDGFLEFRRQPDDYRAC